MCAEGGGEEKYNPTRADAHHPVHRKEGDPQLESVAWLWRLLVARLDRMG